MKYVALVYSNPNAWDELTEAERESFGAQAESFMEELTASGALVGGNALADVSTARTVSSRSGQIAATDGPFAETKEVLVGYYVLDCESIERATELVTKDPAAKIWQVEVRPVMDSIGEDV